MHKVNSIIIEKHFSGPLFNNGFLFPKVIYFAGYYILFLITNIAHTKKLEILCSPEQTYSQGATLWYHKFDTRIFVTGSLVLALKLMAHKCSSCPPFPYQYSLAPPEHRDIATKTLRANNVQIMDIIYVCRSILQIHTHFMDTKVGCKYKEIF